MNRASFPIIYVESVAASVDFYRRLGYEGTYQFPTKGEPDYVSLRRGQSKMGVAKTTALVELLGQPRGEGPRFELFTYVDDLDKTLAELRRAGVRVPREPQDMTW